MHLSARLRVPLAGFALCSTALLISACGGSSEFRQDKKVPTTAVAVVGTETVSEDEAGHAAGAGLRAVQGRQEGLPQAGHGRAQAVAAELRRAARAAGRVRRRRQAAQGRRQAEGRRLQPAEARVAVRQGRRMARSTPTKWKKVLSDNHTTEANVLDNIKDGLLRQAIYVEADEERHRRPTRRSQTYYNKNKTTYATPASRAIRHILVKDKALADKIYSAARHERRAVRGAREEVHDRPGLEEERRKARQHPEGPDRPDLRQGRVQHPDRQGREARQEQLRLARDRGHGRHGPGLPAAARQGAEGDRSARSLLTTKKQTFANKWFTTFQKKLEKNVRYATGFAPAKTTSTAASTAAPATTTG